MSRAGDERLAGRARRGDERAFAAIFERYHQLLYRYCLGILANPEDAQDALQNTMVRALRALPGEERSISLRPWLYRIAHNESIDLLRRRRVTEPFDPDSLPERTAVAERAQIGVVEKVELREELGRLLSDLQELPDRQRGALLMRELSGLSFEEIAAGFDTSPGVARQTVYEARLSLRQMGEGREMSCDEVMHAVSDGDRRVLRRKDIRAHLRACESCARFEAEIARRQEDLAALAPIPALAAAGILGGILGGGGGGAAAAGGAAAGGAAAGGLGSGAAATLASSAALKAVATVAVVAALGTAAADRGGLIQIGGGGDATPSSSSGPTGIGGATGGSSNGTGSGAGQGKPGHAANGGPGTHPRGSQAGAGGPVKAGGRASEPGASGSSPHGKATGHGKSPSSSGGNGGSHGAKENGSHGSGGSNAHLEHPSKPTHPAHPEQAQPPKPPQPAHPASPGVSGPSEVAPPADEGGGAAEGRAQGQGAMRK